MACSPDKSRHLLSLLFVAITLCNGCIALPASWQFQPDGRLRPEYFIGKGKVVEPGTTSFVETFLRISDLTGAYAVKSRESFPPIVYLQSHHNGGISLLDDWQLSEDKTLAAHRFQISTGRTIWFTPPQINVEAEDRWLVLHIDENGVVSNVTTVKHRPYIRSTSTQWLSIFDSQTRQRLHAAGQFPDENFLQRVVEYERQHPLNLHSVPQPR